MRPLISLVLPVREEPDNIGPCLERLANTLAGVEHELLVCYDSDTDSTLPAIERAVRKPERIVLVKNELGRGPSFAMRAGLARASGDVVVTTMADLSDPPELILEMAKKIREHGADVVSGSRYMRGGSQVGGPPLKSALSKAAGVSLKILTGIGTWDATTNFRGYSKRFLDAIEIESGHAFSLGLELTLKAHLLGFKVDEVPSSWIERSHGKSRFRVGPWLPEYLRYYARAAAVPSGIWALWVATAIGSGVAGAPLLPLALRSGGAAASILLARRLRGKSALVDAALPLLANVPLRAVPAPALLRIVGSSLVLMLAERRGRARPWLSSSSRKEQSDA